MTLNTTTEEHAKTAISDMKISFYMLYYIMDIVRRKNCFEKEKIRRLYDLNKKMEGRRIKMKRKVFALCMSALLIFGIYTESMAKTAAQRSLGRGTKHRVIVECETNDGTAVATPHEAAKGDIVVLNAFPKANYSLKKWEFNSSSGATLSSETHGTFIMPDNDVKITAHFEQNKTDPQGKKYHTIVVVTDGNGAAVANYYSAPRGTAVYIYAYPNTGYRLKGWEAIEGDVTVTTNMSLNKGKFYMPDKFVKVKAIFEREYTITLTNDGNGTASADKMQAIKGEEVTLTPNPNAGYVFKKWEVSPAGVNIAGNKFEMPESNVTIKAIFEPKKYTITLTNDGNGTASADKNQAAKGEEVTLTLNPNAG